MLLAENSLRLVPETVIDACGSRPRLFSVDGGHTAEITASDLAIAGRTVCDGRLVILDDSSTPIGRRLRVSVRVHARPANPPAGGDRRHKFVFAKGGAAAAAYRRHLLEQHPQARSSSVLGDDVIRMDGGGGRTLRTALTASRHWRRIRATPRARRCCG